MFTFIHAADIHLDSPLQNLEKYEGAPVDALRAATQHALENLVELAVSRNVDFVVISGDVYDGDWKDFSTGLWFSCQMSELERANIPVYMISGNHDAVSRISKNLRLPENVFDFPADQAGTQYIDNLQVAIHGQSYNSPAVKKNLAAQYPERRKGYFNIGMLHTCATGREGHAPYAPCTLDEMSAKGYDYWALGHVHQKEILRQDPFIVFPGNLQGRHVRETGPKGCMAVTVNDDGQTEMEFCPLDVIRWYRVPVDISKAKDPDHALKYVEDSLLELSDKNIDLPLAVRLELKGASSAHDHFMSDPEMWINQIRANAIYAGAGQIWVEKVLFKTQPASDYPLFSDGPAAQILEFITAAASDPAIKEDLKAAFGPLWKKLPREFRDQTSILQMNDDQWVADMLDDIRPLILNRLKVTDENTPA